MIPRSLFVVLAILAATPARCAATFPRPAIPYAPRTYICFRAASPLVIDGRLDDAAWAKAPWTEDFVDIEGSLKPLPRLRTRAKLLWDSTYVYVAAEMEDPDLWATYRDRDSVIYHENDFEVFLDPDGDTHEYYELEMNARNTVWDLLLLRPYRDGGPAVNAWDIAGLMTAVALDGTLNEPRDHDRGWTAEIALPWKTLAECAHRPAPAKDGDQWRVNFSRVEWWLESTDGVYRKVVDPATGWPDPEANWVWSPQGLVAMHYPEMWGIVQFSQATEGPVAFRPDPDEALRWRLRNVYYAQMERADRHEAYTAAPPLESAADSLLRIACTMTGYEATLPSTTGGTWHIDETGRVWRTEP